ncbi:MAG: hypothetical protein SVV80_14155, partial [Planctomycetota bacterium]|nr:hypothetical protein [Planctomycetota bacterium]
MVQVQLEHLADLRGFVLIDAHSPAVAIGGDVVSEHRTTADPLALAVRSSDLVARPFGDDLPLELGEGQ